MKVIYILWLRQIKRYLRSRSRIIGSLGQPLLFLVALGFGFGPVFQKAGEGNYLNFIAPGIVAMSVLFTATFFGIELIWDRQFGFLKETLVAPVSRFYIVFGRILGGATVAVLQGLIVLVLSSMIGFGFHNYLELPMVVVYLFLIAITFTALGTLIASIMDDMHGFQLVINFLIMPIFFLSGALFPLKDAPVVLGNMARFNPLTYGVDALRGVLVGQNMFALSLDFIVLVLVCVFFLALGVYAFNKIEA